MQNKGKKTLHYAYIILLSLILQKFIIAAEPSVNGLFLLPVTRSLQITQGSFMLYQTVQYAALAAMSTVIPKLMERFRYTSLNRLGLISMSCGIACMGMAQNVWMFYIGGALNGIGLAVSNFLLLGTMIPRWFSSNVGLLIATATLGGTASSIIANPLISRLLDQGQMVGLPAWRGAYFLLALLPISFGLLNAVLLMKESPEDLGLQKCGTESQRKQGQVKKQGVAKEQAFKGKNFLWLISTVIAWNVTSTMSAYLPAYAETVLPSGGQELKGYIGLATTIGSLLGGYLLGFFNDRSGARAGAVLAAAFGVSGCLMMVLGRSSAWLIWLGAAGLGVYMALNSVQLPAMVSDMYGDLDYDPIFQRVSSIAAWFGAFSASFWGFLYDTCGNYMPMLLLAAALCMLTGCAGVWATKKKYQ